MAELPERTMKRQYKQVPDITRKDALRDPYMAILAREQRAREVMVAIEETKMLAEKVKECYKKEGVNHHKNCEEIARAYKKRISQPGLKDSPVEMSDIP